MVGGDGGSGLSSPAPAKFQSWSEGRVPRQPEHPLAHSKLGTAQTEQPVLTLDTVSGSQCSRPPLRVKPQGAPPCSCTGTYWKDPGRFSILRSAQARRDSFSAGATLPPPPAAPGSRTLRPGSVVIVTSQRDGPGWNLLLLRDVKSRAGGSSAAGLRGRRERCGGGGCRRRRAGGGGGGGCDRPRPSAPKRCTALQVSAGSLWSPCERPRPCSGSISGVGSRVETPPVCENVFTSSVSRSADGCGIIAVVVVLSRQCFCKAGET